MKTLLIVFISISNLSCDFLLESKSEETNDLVYFTSFERNTDTLGWQGNGFGLSNEAPQNGGNRSLAVSGGCIWPHGMLALKPLEQDSRLIIRCVGKNLALGGGVSLELGGDHRKSIHISVQDTAWRAYESTDTLFCPAGSTLNLSLGAGGIVYSAMLVDLIEVRKVR